VLLCNDVVTIVTCLARIVKCCQNPIGIGHGFLPQLGQRCFPRKNTVFILLTFCLYPLLSHFWFTASTLSELFLRVFPETHENQQHNLPPSCGCVLSDLTSGIIASSHFKANTLRDPRR